MKKLVVALTAFAAFTAPALAADMAAKAPVRAAPVAYAPSWTGCYIGGGGGYGMYESRHRSSSDWPARAIKLPVDQRWTWLVRHLRAGCDYQFSAATNQFRGWRVRRLQFLEHQGRSPASTALGLASTAVRRRLTGSGRRVAASVGLAIPGPLTYFTRGYTEATSTAPTICSVHVPADRTSLRRRHLQGLVPWAAASSTRLASSPACSGRPISLLAIRRGTIPSSFTATGVLHAASLTRPDVHPHLR